jgi:chemotaxis protein methyltransferase CheR
MKDILPLSADDFECFRDLLAERSGLHFEEGRSQSLHRALWQRLQHRGINSYQEYYTLLKCRPEGRLEIRELLDLVTIGETYFFRNKAQFDALMTFVLPGLLRRKTRSRDNVVRVWSAGCSGGDEAYSIAMAIMETIPSREEWRISILGTDINRNGLARAREAVYGKKAVAHLPKGYLSRYFKVQGSAYRLNPNVSALVCFEYHNLAQDPFFHEGMQQCDILFCRNVMIYFDEQTTQRVIENFHRCLSQGGYLFLGHSETLWQIPHLFERIEFPQTFVYKKKGGLLQEDAVPFEMPVPGIASEPLTFIKETAAEKTVVLKGIDPGLQGKPEAPEQGIKPHRVRPLFSTLPADSAENPRGTDLTKAVALANEAKYKEAAQLLGKIIEADNLSVEAYCLLGILLYQGRRLKEAETQFKKAIYVSPDTVLAYFNLGNMYLHQGKFREAAREFKNAIRLLEKKPKDEQIRYCEDVTVGFLIKTCKNHLNEISKREEGYE